MTPRAARRPMTALVTRSAGQRKSMRIDTPAA
jgi:hypothetical protein